MPPTKQHIPIHLLLTRLLYPFMVVLSFYLLFTSRSGEVYTVWEALHPAFIPVFFVTNLLLLTIVFSSEKLEYKLIPIIIHSILCHTFFVIIFPAGNVGIQQSFLGKTRLVFDNLIFHGFGWAREGLPLQIYVSLRGENLQAAFSVIFARMFGVDVYWTHLLLVPLLWGIFVPLVTFMVSKILGASDNISALSSLIVSLFPANILWGAESIPNGLSYLFFFCFIYFLLKYIKSNTNRTKDFILAAAFFFAASLSHYLAGTIAFSLLILARSIKTYEEQKASSPISARLMLLLAFVFCANITPFALAYRRFFYPSANTSFSLQKLYELPSADMVLSLLFGSYFDLISREAYITTIIFGVAPLLGLIALTYIILANVKKSPKRSISPPMLFLSLGLLMVVVDDRILKLFMINVPFVEFERLWLFRDFLLVPFTTLIIGAGIQEMRAFFIILSRNTVAFLGKTSLAHILSKASLAFKRSHVANCVSLASVSAYVLAFTILSGWITASVYYAYPHRGPLQTTSYEIEAVKYIDGTTDGTYIVICDQWMIFAGQMFVGVNNPRAFYFSTTDPKGLALFFEMKRNATSDPLIQAMEFNNATTAYFIIEEPRLGKQKYDNIIEEAQQNGLQTYHIFHYQGKEKLRIFYYKK